MDVIADGLLIAGALAAAFYCWVLSVRVKGLKDLDQGLGAAIASLSTQVNDMRATLKTTQASAGASAESLNKSTEDAVIAAERLEALIGSYQALQPGGSPRAVKPKRAAPTPAPQPAPAAETAKPAGSAAQAVQAVRQKMAGTEPAAEPKAEPAETAAQRLHENIRERVNGRSESGNKEDFVKALQSVLAAANK